METVLIITAKLIGLILDVVAIAMIARMLLPMLFDMEDSKIYTFIFFVTEPFIIPVRFLLYKLNLFQDSPIDFGFTIAYMVLVLLRLFLP